MKTFILSIITTCLTIGLNAQTLNVQQIVEKIENNERVPSSIGHSKQTIITSSGKTRTLEMISYSKDKNDKQLTVYTSPSRVKGDKILMLDKGNEIWFYTPKTDRVRHLASHAKRQKVQGSDFSYEDMSGWDYKKDFICKLLDEETINGKKAYQIELVPTESGPHYSKMILWADKQNFSILKVDYYEDGELFKRLINSNIEEISGYWIPNKMVMKNLLDGGETTIEMSEIKINTDIEDNIFTTNYLKKN